MRGERERTRTGARGGTIVLAALALAACGGEAIPAAAPAATDEVSGRWLLRSSEALNECEALGSFRPFDLGAVQLRKDADALEVVQGAGDRVVYARAEQGWTRSAAGEWEGCRVVATASLSLRRLASARLAGRYEAHYETAGGAACEGLPVRCTVVHDLTGVRP